MSLPPLSPSPAFAMRLCRRNWHGRWWARTRRRSPSVKTRLLLRRSRLRGVYHGHGDGDGHGHGDGDGDGDGNGVLYRTTI